MHPLLLLLLREEVQAWLSLAVKARLLSSLDVFVPSGNGVDYEGVCVCVGWRRHAPAPSLAPSPSVSFAPRLSSRPSSTADQKKSGFFFLLPPFLILMFLVFQADQEELARRESHWSSLERRGSLARESECHGRFEPGYYNLFIRWMVQEG